jgi:hypothetical protein
MIMKKHISCLVLLAVLVFSACEQPAGGGNGRPADRIGLTALRVDALPDITLYAKGQPFTPAGLAVSGIYSDGSTTPLDESAYTLSPVDTAVPGMKRVTVSAGSVAAKFAIYVDNSTKVLTSVELTSPPFKREYYLGEDIDLSGMEVTGTYSDESTTRIDTSRCVVAGYDKLKRGPQTVTMRVNRSYFDIDVTLKVPSTAVVRFNAYGSGSVNHQIEDYREVYIRGEPFDFAKTNLKAAITLANGEKSVLSTKEGGGITGDDIDISGYDPETPGYQTITVNLDEASASYPVYVADTAPAVYFDYGYMRTSADPGGMGRDEDGAAACISTSGSEAAYRTPVNQMLVLAPVRFLIGYDSSNNDLGADYAWSVTGGPYVGGSPADGETFSFTPAEAGTYTVTVSVTGRNYITGQNDTKTAQTSVIAFGGTETQRDFVMPLKNFGCGQYSESGSGHGWSTGSAGGYWVWKVEHRESYLITGNPMSNWSEPGVVLVMEDNNHNGVPDEIWYELKGSDDDASSAYKSLVTRRYSLSYFNGGGAGYVNEYGQTIRGIFWVDCKGRTGRIPGGWPGEWGVPGSDNEQVTYTGTLLRDDGQIATGSYGGLDNFKWGYVDSAGIYQDWNRFYVSNAIRADGTPVTLTDVRFIKVQTAAFRYGGIFGDISTEIKNADFMGLQTDFPDPEGGL